MSNILDKKLDNKIDTKEVVKEQYKNSSNLDARLNLHNYNTNKEDWNLWFFSRMQIPQGARVLELGCGNGLLWKKNENLIQHSWDITLSDFSEGMLESAKKTLESGSDNSSFKYETIDIQNIPYEDESFDIVIARHMLYHVPDLDKALCEVNRVLKKGGTFYASTNGKGHMEELNKLANAFDKDFDFTGRFNDKFGIDNGAEILGRYFSEVKMEEFRGLIVVEEVEPVVSYIASTMSSRAVLRDENRLKEFYAYMEKELEKAGAFRITTRGGLLASFKL